MIYFLAAITATTTFDPAPALAQSDVVWTTPSSDSAGSMPIGNGEVVLNVWVEDKSGDLLFLVARGDAFSEISRILKLGRIRVHLDPSPFQNAHDFSQHLHLENGNITFDGGGTHLQLFVDSAANVVHLSGTSATALRATASLEDWRTAPRPLPKSENASAWSVHDAPFPLVEAADHIESGAPGVTWYHRNESSVVPKVWENQSLTGLPGTFDPLLHRTFGGRLVGEGFTKISDLSLQQSTPQHHFELSLATEVSQTPDVESWNARLAAVERTSPLRQAAARTTAWWHAFWDRSWLTAAGPGAKAITDGYTLQRYVQACQGRGEYPIKFNGGSYTVEPTPLGRQSNADYRAWGDSHWWQNVRHMYHPMLESGDFEMMEPLFRLYEACRPLAESRTELYHHVKGAYFPETMTIFGTYSGGDYGWDRTGHQPQDVLCPWWQYAWNQGLELTALMLDRWDYTRDRAFLQKRVLPMATSVLTYFDTRFKRDGDGRLILDPTQAVETLWSGVVNDMPSTAGLIAVTQRLCELPLSLVNPEQHAFFARMKAACPQLPVEVKDGVAGLAPAQKYDPQRSNCENPELYAVWPFRVVSLANPALLDQGKAAYQRRVNHLDVGWGYDGNAAALLGMTDEAARILAVKCANSHKGYRWPASWGPNFDYLPDQNHGGNLLNTADLMLLQGEPLEAGGKIWLLPAWPVKWDANFRLHAPGNTTVTCVAEGGVIRKLEVTPAARRKDIVFPTGWKVASD